MAASRGGQSQASSPDLRSGIAIDSTGVLSAIGALAGWSVIRVCDRLQYKTRAAPEAAAHDDDADRAAGITERLAEPQALPGDEQPGRPRLLLDREHVEAVLGQHIAQEFRRARGRVRAPRSLSASSAWSGVCATGTLSYSTAGAAMPGVASRSTMRKASPDATRATLFLASSQRRRDTSCGSATMTKPSARQRPRRRRR